MPSTIKIAGIYKFYPVTKEQTARVYCVATRSETGIHFAHLTLFPCERR
ncbi:hypothetical protein Hdeb2414_s0012g00384771 [Helianthus debilis subsp. tardiflorus]